MALHACFSISTVRNLPVDGLPEALIVSNRPRSLSPTCRTQKLSLRLMSTAVARCRLSIVSRDWELHDTQHPQLLYHDPADRRDKAPLSMAQI